MGAAQPAQPAAAAAAPMPAPMVTPIRNTQAMPYIVMGLVVLVVFLLGWGVSNALQVRAQTEPTLQAPRQVKTDLMATTQPTPGMPPSVHDWLEHLRRTEEQKNRLNAEQVASLKMFTAKFEALGPAAGLLSNDGDDDNTNPAVPVEKMTTDMVEPWKKLIKDFQSVPPPPECQPLADEYFSALNEIPAEMSDIQNLLENLTQSMTNANSGETDANKDALKNAQTMQGKSKESIDSHLINSDEMLGEVCDKYHTRKWFSITSDLGGGLLNSPF